MAQGSFVAQQLERLRPIWETMLGHRFLIETRDGTIQPERFIDWMRQDYWFVERSSEFMAALIPRAPRHHWRELCNVIDGLDKELKLFEDRAAAVNIRLRDAQPSFTNHAYIQFLLSTAYRASYPEAYTVYYVAEKAYFDSWSVVKAGIATDSPWYPFVEHWAGEGFGQYVRRIGQQLDTIAEEAGTELREAMAEYFELTTKYELAFWEMAATGETWPGVDD